MSNFYPTSTIDQVNSQLDIRTLMQAIDYRFEKYQENAKNAKGFCPIHREGLFRNLVIDKEARTFRCQYTQCAGSQGGNLVSLYAQAQGLEMDAAVRAIVRDQALEVELPVDEKALKADLDQARASFDAKNLDDAEAIYLKILEAAPNCADAHLGLLHIYEGRGDAEQRASKVPTVCRLKIAEGKAAEVPELIQEWSETDSDSAEARFACAELLHSRGETESAIIEFMGGGDACEGAGDLEAALHAYRRASALSTEYNIDVIDVTPYIVRVLTQLGHTGEAVEYLASSADRAAAAGDMDSAADFYIMALEVEPENLTTHKRFLDGVSAAVPTSIIAENILASAQFLKDHDEFDRAVQALENFLAVAPEDENALHALINEYNNYGRAQEAMDLESRLARVLYNSGRVDEAAEIVERVLTWQPQHVLMLDVLAQFQELEEKPLEACETRRRLVKALLAQKRYDEALEYAEQLDKESANSEDVMDLKASALEGQARGGDVAARENAAAALEILADRHIDETTGRRAVDYLQRAIDLHEAPPNELYFKLARAYLRNRAYPQVRDTVISVCENLTSKDKLDEAILEAERFSNLMPDDTDLVRYLVELYLRFDDKTAAIARMRILAQDLKRLGREAEAEEVQEQANDLEPQNEQTLNQHLINYRAAHNDAKVQQTLLRLAALYEQEGKHAEAATSLEEYLKEKPDDGLVVNRIITSYEKVGEDTSARQWRLHLARIFRSDNDNDREARTLRDILSKFPNDEEALHMLINAEFNRDDLQAGVTIARRLAALQVEAGKNEAARKTLLKAVERVPENLDVNREIYEIHRKANQPNQALTWGHKVINILKTSSRNADAAIIYDQLVQLDTGNLPLKQEQLRFLEETGRDADVVEKRLGLAAFYRTQERFRDAEAMLLAVIKTDSRNIDARQQLADLYKLLGENIKSETQFIQLAGIHHLEGESARAIELLEQVLVTNPTNVESRKQLSQIYRTEGNIRAAVAQLLELADSYRSQNLEVEAIAIEREAIELDATNTHVRRRLVNNLLSSGRQTQAADELEVIAKQSIEAGDSAQAMEQLKEIIEMEPGRLSARKLRAEMLAAEGKTDEAMAELKELADLALSGVGTQTAPKSISETIERRTLQIVEEYTFEHFVVGANNDFAHATALAIARSPARAYNPFFLYANVGLGKTHLCNAIANYLLQHDPKAQIIYTNSEEFTDELVEAIQNNGIQEFRTRYRSLDLLIVDDVQFLAGKERAQEEFFHIFNSLFQAKRQIVITSDRPPSEIAHLESRLRSRFGAGVIVDIASPDLETRLAILNREVEENNLQLEAWVPRIISEKVDTNVRDLKGALNQTIAMRDLRKQSLTEENVGQMLEALYPAAAV